MKGLPCGGPDGIAFSSLSLKLQCVKSGWGGGLPQSNPLPAKPAMSFISFAPEASSKLGIKKPLILCMKGLPCGGPDGTRTRDPLRDRQVF